MSEFIDQSQIDIRYERSYGIHEFTLHDERRVTVVSQPDWSSFSEAVDALEAPGELITTPELITAPRGEDEAKDIAALVMARNTTAREAMARFPGSIMLLGTVPGLKQGKPQNGITYLQGGREIGRTFKTPYVGEEEKAAFGQMTDIAESRPLDEKTLPVICSDILYHGANQFIKLDTLPSSRWHDPLQGKRSMLVAAAWAMPLAGHSEATRLKGESRYLEPLEFAVNALFKRYAMLNDIVITDRALAGTGEQIAPFNAHYQRKQPTI